MEPSANSIVEYCYCATKEPDFYMIACNSCKNKFHPACLKSGRPSPLAGDIYFIFTCSSCSPTGVEIVKRMKLQWTLVIMLALYNLQLEGSGKCGYFRWREHICRYIDKHWSVIFGGDRKKSATWHGTVAGALSTGANRFFISGCEVLGETGWWSLKSSRMPALDELEAIALNLKTSRKRKNPAEPEQVVLEGCRRKNQNVVEAAVALKEKQSTIDTFDLTPAKIKKKRPDQNAKNFDYSIFPPNHKLKFIVDSTSTSNSYHGDSLSPSGSKISVKTEQTSPVSFSFDDPNFNLKDAEVDLDMPNMYNIDLFNDLDVPDTFLDDTSEINSETSSIIIKQEVESDTESNCDKMVGTPKKQFPDTSRKRTVITKEENPVKEVLIMESKFKLLSAYEEEAILQMLENFQTTMSERPDLRQFYRKLKVRKLKRERNLPIFDIDAEVRSLRGMDPPDYYCQETKPKTATEVIHSKTIFDRFQTKTSNIVNKSKETTSFLTRLMGKSEDQLESIISPYSGRVLKPFIFRDYKTKPLKVKLLDEIRFHSNRNNKDWVKPEEYPIDYCYVRPEFIPSINMLCQEFFWPGIDMQECLQYPDFSCVALYRKIIIGFAFMVPDVNYNEAYITFIFCHPEWRNCGISTFMLYHLIQTCMGKDITLHVSATSPAIFLYQKFCFKIEELIHDFYDKYLPADSKECRHAFFLRLTR